MISLFINSTLQGTSVFFLALVFGCAVNQGCRNNRNLPPVVVFEGHNGKTTRVNVEVVSNDEDRARGLMFRRHLKPDAGMLFVYRFEDNHAFWMKNTYIPLDMIHFSHDKKIVGYIENAQPHDLSSQSIHKPSQYVLEVNAFFMRRYQINQGWKVKFVDIASCY